jgi:hypothetical protein
MVQAWSRPHPGSVAFFLGKPAADSPNEIDATTIKVAYKKSNVGRLKD